MDAAAPDAYRPPRVPEDAGRDAATVEWPPFDGGPTCNGDADCDDGDASTHEYCHSILRVCIDTECTSDAHCDDGDPCTVDTCLSRSSCGHGSANCCRTDVDCDDGSMCTDDVCGADQLCSYRRNSNPGCIPCPDVDRDGDPGDWCGGRDCDDRDPQRNGIRAEQCDNRIDDDCDQTVDALDLACRPANATCPGSPIALGVATRGLAVNEATRPSEVCAASTFYRVELTELSDVRVTVRLDDPVRDPNCESCIPETMSYVARLESTCGDATTDQLRSSCTYWMPTGGGRQSSVFERRRVPPGSYTLEVQAGPRFPSTARAIEFTVTIEATPSVPARCDGVALRQGASVRASTAGAGDAFGAACDGRSAPGPERVHPFTITERSRVRVIAEPNDLASGRRPGVRLAISASCEADAPRVACVESNGSTCQPSSRLEQVLEPGAYFVLVEDVDGGPIDYAIELRTEPVGAACVDAPVIRATGSTEGTTVGQPDAFGDSRVCGGGGGPDRVYALELTTRSRVVLDAIASFPRAQVTVYAGCGERRVAASLIGSSRVDTRLDPGRYDVVVGGERAGDQGSFVLSTTIVPVP